MPNVCGGEFDIQIRQLVAADRRQGGARGITLLIFESLGRLCLENARRSAACFDLRNL
jgi:hypothetical protein